MNRKRFLQLATAIISGVAMNASIEHDADAASPKGVDLDDSYLVRGLTGMSKAGGWFNAHWGAAVLAGYYLCKENQLSAETTAAIKTQLDALISLQESQFALLPNEPADKTLIERVPEALAPAIEGGLRAHGHAVIFASLSLKALRDAPSMAQPKVIEGLCGLSHQIAKKNPQRPGEVTSYADTQTMVEATFDCLARFEDLVGHPTVKRPNFTHMITHTEALLNLDSMGYPDLVKAGQLGHAFHIGAAVPTFDPKSHPRAEYPVTLDDVMSKNYWEDNENIRRWNRKWSSPANRNGYWIAFGHLFKVLYSYHQLIARVQDEELVRLCSTILLERYLNPEVQGG